LLDACVLCAGEYGYALAWCERFVAEEAVTGSLMDVRRDSPDDEQVASTTFERRKPGSEGHRRVALLLGAHRPTEQLCRLT
jgi:hypothetical protein